MTLDSDKDIDSDKNSTDSSARLYLSIAFVVVCVLHTLAIELEAVEIDSSKCVFV